MKRHPELWFLLQMAGAAKLGLRFAQQGFGHLRVMRRMARDAAHIVLAMQRICRVYMLGGRGVTGEAAIVDFLGGMIGKDENLGFVSASGYVGRAGTVAAFTSLRMNPIRGLRVSGSGCRTSR